MDQNKFSADEILNIHLPHSIELAQMARLSAEEIEHVGGASQEQPPRMTGKILLSSTM